MSGRLLEEISDAFILRKLTETSLGGDTPAQLLARFLEEVGEEDIRFAVENNISLWTLFPPEWKRAAVEDNTSWWLQLAQRLPSSTCGRLIHKALSQTSPKYGVITTPRWFTRFVDDYKAE